MINEDRKNFKPNFTIDKNYLGNILTRKEDILQQWTKYFKELLIETLKDNRLDGNSVDVVDLTTDFIYTSEVWMILMKSMHQQHKK